MKRYNCVVIGGGPAGITAAIYLARYNRSVLVIDKKQGRSTYPQINENYLGFPKGIEARRLRALGQKQAKRFGAEFFSGEVTDCRKENGVFLSTVNAQTIQSSSLILATGVVDIFPKIEGITSYVGKSLFWCITCDGYRTRDKRVVVIGKDDEAVTTCLQFLNYTKELAFVLNCDWRECSITEKKRQDLTRFHIPIFEGKLTAITGNDSMVRSIVTDRGEEILTDYIFNQQGAKPNGELAKMLGVKIDENGYILCDEEQRTHVPFVYAAGDVTRIFSHQVVTASHEGATTGQTANYDLYESYQKE